MTGYDLKKTFDSTAQHFWAADRSQIYRTLGNLHADGLLDEHVIRQRSRPDRHEHRHDASPERGSEAEEVGYHVNVIICGSPGAYLAK